MIAKHGTAEHVERLVRSYRRCNEAAELSREAQQQANRYLESRSADDGSIIIQARLPAEAGALIMKAIDAAARELDRPQQPTASEGHDASAEAPPLLKILTRVQRADALSVIAESFLKHGIESLNGGDRHQIVVHVDTETLRECTAGCCEIENGPSIAAETARRLACDASVIQLIENDKGEPLDVGRKTRTISTALRRVLNAREVKKRTDEAAQQCKGGEEQIADGVEDQCWDALQLECERDE